MISAPLKYKSLGTFTFRVFLANTGPRISRV